MARGSRKQLRELEERRDEGFRELGGLALEMYRRGNFDLDLLQKRAKDLAEVESQIRELSPRG
jgi:hypothetical protein